MATRCTDDPGLNPKAAVSLLDAFRDFFDEYWEGRTELAPYDKRSRVFLFYSFEREKPHIEPYKVVFFLNYSVAVFYGAEEGMRTAARTMCESM